MVSSCGVDVLDATDLSLDLGVHEANPLHAVVGSGKLPSPLRRYKQRCVPDSHKLNLGSAFFFVF